MGARPWRLSVLAGLMALYPLQDSFVRGEVSPRLHARASLDFYRSALSLCENFITMPHGGIRKRGCTYFAGEVKSSASAVRLIPFIFSADQAYCLEFGNLYIRVYAYGARVGTVEVVSPWATADLDDLFFYQSADVMWIAHPAYQTRTLTRESNTTWTLATLTVEDGPYLDINTTSTTLTPAKTGSATPLMTDNTTPSGTVSSSDGGTDSYKLFDQDNATQVNIGTGSTATVTYDFGSGVSKVVDAYGLTAPADNGSTGDMPSQWRFQGSSDGSTWATLDAQTSQSGWIGSETRYYDFENEASFRYYRFLFGGGGGTDGVVTTMAEISLHQAASDQTPFNLTASSTTGINDGAGFKTTDVGRAIRLLGSDALYRWAEIVSRTSATVVTVRMHGQVLPDTSPIVNWRLGAWSTETGWPDSVTVFEERLSFGKSRRINASKTGDFTNFAVGEKDDDALEFLEAGGGQANDIVWIEDSDGALIIATAGGIRALSGSGIDEALTPSSFKNRKSRTYGAARIAPVDAGSSFVYVTRSRRQLAELVADNAGRFASSDIAVVNEHIPKKGVIELGFQSDPDPFIWFPVDTGELGCYTLQADQEVRGVTRHKAGGALSGSSWPAIERCVVTPGQNGPDDVWLVVRRTINGATKRYIEVMQPPFEYADLEDAVQVDCALSYSGAATGTLTGLSHLEGQTVDVLAINKVYRGLTVSGGSVTLPGGATTTKATVGLPVTALADTLELDVGGKDGSLLGRRKKVSAVILSLFETDLSGLTIRSLMRGAWEPVKLPTNVASDGTISLFTGNVAVPIDDSWEGMGKVEIRHVNPTPCTIRGLTPIFDSEP